MPEDSGEVYKQTAELFRHYLSWREKLFAGYFAAMGALAIAFGKMRLNQYFKPAGFLVPAVAALLSIAFFLLDKRNDRLRDYCGESASALELDAKVKGAFAALYEDKDTLTHRNVVGAIYLLGLFGAGVTALITYLRD